MTIKRKNITVGGLVEAEADNTDSVDTGGNSAKITGGTGAITAKYSGGATIQAPVGLRVGTTQIKIVAGVEHLPSITLISSDWASGANIVDGDLFTVSGTLDDVLPTVMEVIVDFGSIESRTIGTKFNIAQKGNLAVTLFIEFTSRIFISDTLSFGAEEANQVDKLFGTDTGPQNSDRTFNLSARSFRYIKFTMEQLNNVGNQRVGDCSVYSVNKQLLTPTNAVIDIRSSNTIDTADGAIIRASVTVPPGATTVIDDDLLLVEAQKYLTLAVKTASANLYDLNLDSITSITEV